jgi:hypothetical protein
MDRNERQIIDDLFDRLGDAERRAGPRDSEAERLIRDHLAAQPAAPYYMAQALVVQQEALARAQARLEQLERAGSGGGFLGGLFGGERAPAPPPSRHARGPWAKPSGGGGFLAGAAQTALGVAGGVLIADAVADLFTPDAAAAAEAGLPEEPGAEDLGADAGFDADMGFDDF